MGDFNYKIGIYGTGNMGRAILSGIAASGKIPSGSIIVYDIDEEKARSTANEHGVKAGTFEETASSETVFICVKPQQIKTLLDNLKKAVYKETIIISIAAGVSTASIEAGLDNREIAVVRAMPNTPALIGKGITVFCTNGKLSESQRKYVEELLLVIGDVVPVREVRMDLVTALSGSGPAYFYYLADALIESGVKLGLDEETAKKLVGKTFTGSAALFEKTGKSLDGMISMVKSKGGTTEAALDYLSENKFDELIENAVQKAKERAANLSEIA